MPRRASVSSSSAAAAEEEKGPYYYTLHTLLWIRSPLRL